MPGVLTDLASWLRVALAALSFLRKGLVRCTFNAARSRLFRKMILAGGVATISPMIECGTPLHLLCRERKVHVPRLQDRSAFRFQRSREGRRRVRLEAATSGRWCGRCLAHTESHSLDAYTTRPFVSNDPRDVEAVFEGATAGSDLQPHNCSVLQDRFQSAVVSYSYVTAQSENDPRVSLHALYLKGADWMCKRD
jgi:hypothetical protein